MPDDEGVWRAHMTVSPDGQSAVAEAPTGSYLIEVLQGSLPYDLGISTVLMDGHVITCLDFPEGTVPCPVSMHFKPRSDEQETSP